MDTNPDAEVTELDGLMDTLDNAEIQSDVVESEAVEATDEETDEAAPEGQAEDDSQEVELDGETLKLPKKVAEAVLRQQDYTKKTQEVAERRRSVEDREQFLAAREHLMVESFKEAAELQSLQTQLKQYEAVDWNTLINDDPQQAMRLSFARQQLQTQLSEKQASFQGIAKNIDAAKKLHQTKQLELGRAELQRRVGNLSEVERANTWKQGVDLGYSEAELGSTPDPRLMHALYKAAKWDALQAAKPKAMQKVAEAPKAIKPVAPTPQRQQQNKAALDRLKASGRATDLMAFLK